MGGGRGKAVPPIEATKRSSQEGKAGKRRAIMTYGMLTFFLNKKRKKKRARASQAGGKARKASGRSGKQTSREQGERT
jgi:hypothetical protein